MDTPNQNHEKNYYSAGYGRNVGRRGVNVFYAKLELIKRFNKHLTVKEMKNDIILSKTGFIRRSLQGTIFKVDESAYKRIESLLDKKNIDGK